MLLLIVLLSQIEIRAELDKHFVNKKLSVGEPFQIILTLKYPHDLDVSTFFVDSLEPFVIIDQKNKTVREKGYVSNVYTIKAAAFKTGELEIPPFKFLYRHDDGIDTLKSNTIPIRIESVMPADMKDINDIKKAIEFPNYLPLIIAAVVIIGALLAYFAYKFLKRLKKERIMSRPLPPPWVEALAAIENIPVVEWLEKGLIKKYYYTLSEILKRYLERRFEFNAAEQTTTEIINNLKLQKVPSYDGFRNFFTQADLVKYAKFTPSSDEMEKAVDVAKELIDKTKPQTEEKETDK